MVNKRRCNDFICASLSLLIILLSEYDYVPIRKLSCAVEILIWSDAVDFLTKLLGMPYSVVTAQQACSTEMVKCATNPSIISNKPLVRLVAIVTQSVNKSTDI